MKIRLARDEDYAAIACLRRQTIRNVNAKDYPEDIIRGWSAKSGARDFRESADRCKRWVALDKEKIVGVCEHSFACELSRLYVHKDYLRKALGSRLLKVAEDSLAKLGCKEITLVSTITAKDFYEKNGYVMIEKTRAKADGAEIYRMSKKLREADFRV